MLDALFQLSIFSAKVVIIFIFILLLVAGIIALFSRGKDKQPGHGRITINHLNKKYADIKETLLHEILPKKSFKRFIKDKKATEKTATNQPAKKNIFIIDFDGDIKASAVSALREEVTAILSIASPNDEVVVRLESAGGMVHAYGLAAAQLSRIRDRMIPLTVTVDKVAASGGYLMACIANRILAAPFAIIGSIGVIVQLPNFNRVLKDHHIDFEQLTAGNYKRTLTLFGENTDEGREKLHQEIEEIHGLFKNLIKEHRQQVDIQQVATGEHWLATQAINLKLVDELRTSDDYLLALSNEANLYEIVFQTKKSLSERLFAGIQQTKKAIFQPSHYSL